MRRKQSAICPSNETQTHNQHSTMFGLNMAKNKAIPLQACIGPYSSRRLRFPTFLDNRHMKVVRLSALLTGRLYPQEDISVTHLC